MEPIQHLMFAEVRAEPRDHAEPMDSPSRVSMLTRVAALLRSRQVPAPSPLADCA